MRFLSLILALTALSFAQPLNTNGWRDTASLTIDGTETKYTDPFFLAAYEYATVHVFVDDTTSAGFASDSIQIWYGAQVGSPTIDTAGDIDTVWSTNIITIDTLSTDSLGKAHIVTYDGTGAFTTTLGGLDTTNVVGWATQSTNIPLPFDAFVRFRFTGITDNGTEVKVKLQLVQRQAQRTSR